MAYQLSSMEARWKRTHEKERSLTWDPLSLVALLHRLCLSSKEEHCSKNGYGQGPPPHLLLDPPHKATRPFPSEHPLSVSLLASRDPLPVRSYEPANSQGVIKEEISAKGKLFRQFFSYQAAFGGERARRWAVAFLGFLPPSSNTHPASGRNRGHVLSLLERKKGLTEKAG